MKTNRRKLIRRLAVRTLYTTFIVLLSSSLIAQDATITGFRPANAQHQIELEKQFKSRISSESARAFHRIFTAEPHVAGSDRNNELADYIADTWKKQGLEDVVIRRYDVLNSFPKEVSVEMIAPVQYRAGLREAAYDVDPDTKNPRVHSGWLSMSTSGEVTAPIIYAHSGNPSDYDLLRKHGISVKGKVVLVRYSNPYSYRGFKALTAQREGAAAILIYSDPAEDGFKKGKVFPDGPWGPETHIQRGAITYDFIVPGDPLTPGWASVPGAKQIPPEEAQSLPKIMAVALSWADAKPLLQNMGGPAAPKSWEGGLPIKYRLGGQGKVHVKVDMDTRVMPNYVVEARIRGAENPDEWVVLGNHRDAWEFGGVDPSSGTASMMEMTRVLGEMLKEGKRPGRTLVFCSWDGEEVGLTGSTEWGEQFADELKQKAVAYLNVDSSTSGPNLTGSAVGSLAPFLVEITKSLPDPATKGTLYEAWKTDQARKRKESKSKEPVTDGNLADVRIGSGSDHTVFLNHVGVPVIGLQFDGPYGVYHSMYDNYYWMNHIGDPGYRYHVLMSQLWGVTALRLANADALPFDFAAYANNVRQFVSEIQRKTGVANNLQLTSLLTQISALEKQGGAFNTALQQALKGKTNLDAANRSIMQVERNWLNDEGIPGRPWFKHTLYAARYTYAHLELPGLTEAVEKQDWQTAKQQAEILRMAVEKNTALLKQTVSDLGNKPAD
jgi:N-acetylated-alpha-linked acidic dipeptidase